MHIKVENVFRGRNQHPRRLPLAAAQAALAPHCTVVNGIVEDYHRGPTEETSVPTAAIFVG